LAAAEIGCFGEGFKGELLHEVSSRGIFFNRPGMPCGKPLLKRAGSKGAAEPKKVE
jgi:hypothetical protein